MNVVVVEDVRDDVDGDDVDGMRLLETTGDAPKPYDDCKVANAEE